jgi:hypothetical protein
MGKVRKPRIALLVVRVLLIAALAALLSFAIALFFGIIGVVVINLIRGGGTSLTAAYRQVASPVALIAFTTALVASLVFEIRHYRRTHRVAKISLSRIVS